MPVPQEYWPALAYLATVTVVMFAARRVPPWLHLAALAALLPARVWTTGWLDTLIAAGIALLVFLVAVPVLGRVVGGATLFSIVGGLALAPFPNGWLGVFGGLLLAGAVGAVRTAMLSGKDRVQMLTLETAMAMGVQPGVGYRKPDADLLPSREVAEQAAQGQGRSARMHLPPYLLAGVLLAALLAA